MVVTSLMIIHLFIPTAELRYVEVVGTQKNTLTKEWFEITIWALLGAKHVGKVSVLKRMLTFKHPFTIIYFVHWRI